MTNLKNVNQKGKKKLQKVYNANKYKKLNEVPVPTIYDENNEIESNPENLLKTINLLDHIKFDDNLIGRASFAKRTKEEKLRKKLEREQKRKQREENRRLKAMKAKRKQLMLNDSPVHSKGKNKNKNRDKKHGVSTELPLHPRKIVEEISHLDFPFIHNETNKNL